MTINAPHCVVIALLIGCGGADRGAVLTVTGLRLDEKTVPLPFVVALHNDSDEPVEIEGVSVKVTSKSLIFRTEDAERIPKGFDYQVKFDPNHPAEVAANSDGVACGFVAWELPTDPPPMIAVVTCQFRVQANGKELLTEPITLVLQSKEGLLEGVGDDSPLAEEQAKKVLEALSRTPGRKSEGLRRLARQLGNADQGK